MAFASSPVSASETDEGKAPADLRLEWKDGGRSPEPLNGAPNAAISIPYRLRNVGQGDAFAVILEAWTDLGRLGGVVRLQPGPKAGARLERTLVFDLVEGMTEICLLARLQTIETSDPRDPSPDNNRLCRPLVVESASRVHGWSPASFPRRP